MSLRHAATIVAISYDQATSSHRQQIVSSYKCYAKCRIIKTDVTESIIAIFSSGFFVPSICNGVKGLSCIHLVTYHVTTYSFYQSTRCHGVSRHDARDLKEYGFR